MNLHAKPFWYWYPVIIQRISRKQQRKTTRKVKRWKIFAKQPYMHMHLSIKEEMQILLNFLRQKLFSKILTAFSSNESTPSTATIWYCFSFKLPTNFRSSLRLVPSLFCFSSFCISWAGHPGSNSSKHKVLFFFSSMPTTVWLWPNFKIDFQYFKTTEIPFTSL